MERQLNYKRRESFGPKIVECEDPDEMSSQHESSYRKESDNSQNAISLGSSSSNDSMTCNEDISCSTSESGSDSSDNRRRSRSIDSLRRIFETLNFMRSKSSSPNSRAKNAKKNSQPKSLLRPPVRYTYVRGPSGLPTQRVPFHMAYYYDI